MSPDSGAPLLSIVSARTVWSKAARPAIAAILVIVRLCEPASEFHIAKYWYRRTALDDLLEVPAERINDDRLYRALDRLLPHKQALETHLKGAWERCSISTMSCCCMM